MLPKFIRAISVEGETTVATCVISATAPNVVPNVVPDVPAKKQASWDDSQRTLVQRAQAGDEQAFATLFQMHQKRVYSVCLLMTKDVAEAEDLTQEAFLQVFRTVGSFGGAPPFPPRPCRVGAN